MKLIISRESVTDKVRYHVFNPGDTIKCYNTGAQDKPFMLMVYKKKLFKKPE